MVILFSKIRNIGGGAGFGGASQVQLRHDKLEEHMGLSSDRLAGNYFYIMLEIIIKILDWRFQSYQNS